MKSPAAPDLDSRRAAGARLAAALALALCLGPAPARAHYPWMTPADYAPEPGNSLEFSIGWGHVFPGTDTMSGDRLESAELLDAEGTVHPLALGEGAEFTTLPLPGKGPWVLAARQRPGFYSRTLQGGQRHAICCTRSSMARPCPCALSLPGGATQPAGSSPTRCSRRGSDTPFQSGRVNALGELSFRPDRPGPGACGSFTEDGHGAVIEVTVDEAMTVTGAGGGHGHAHGYWPRVLAALGYLLGVFGLLALWRARRARAASG
jgi:hypothetical protein